MKRPLLKAEPRTILGKRVKKLRREGILPANVYGRDLASVAVQVDTKTFSDLLKTVGETGLVDLEVEGKKRPVLIKNVQADFRTHTPLHTDFFQVNLKEKVKTMVPLEFVGEAKAVEENIGVLNRPISEVEVEALPADLPEHIAVHLEPLAEVNAQITVGDLSAPEGVTILTDPGQVVAKVAEIVVEEEPEPASEEGPEGEASEAATGDEPTDSTESTEEQAS